MSQPLKVRRHGQATALDYLVGLDDCEFNVTLPRRADDRLLLRAFSYIFGLGGMFLLVAIAMLIIMDKRPLRTTVLAAQVRLLRRISA